MISANIPCRSGLSADAGPGTGFEWTPGGRGRGAGSREAREIRMFNNWATGLRSGLLPEGCGVATPKGVQKRTKFERSFREGFIFDARGWIVEGFQQVLAGLPHVFYRG